MGDTHQPKEGFAGKKLIRNNGLFLVFATLVGLVALLVLGWRLRVPRRVFTGEGSLP